MAISVADAGKVCVVVHIRKFQSFKRTVALRDLRRQLNALKMVGCCQVVVVVVVVRKA
jgi:hypothetical protein